jgi:hypothetical protein
MATKSPPEADDRQAADSTDPLFADYHALLIGISKYQTQDRIDWALTPIPGADRDAQSMKETLRSVGYSPLQIHCLCNEEASLQGIDQKLAELREIWRSKLLLLFWGGHGVYRKDQRRSFLLPYDANLDDLDRTAFPVDEIIRLTKRSGALNKAIFLDTCHSAPKFDRGFLQEWEGLDRVSADPALTFVGASTYLALGRAGAGGILTSCLKDALTAQDATLCDEEGTVHLDDVMIYLQRHLLRRAWAAWEGAGKAGLAPQYPYIVRQLGDSVPVGRNVARHVRHCVERGKLPGPVRELAAMIISRHWPGGTGR